MALPVSRRRRADMHSVCTSRTIPASRPLRCAPTAFGNSRAMRSIAVVGAGRAESEADHRSPKPAPRAKGGANQILPCIARRRCRSLARIVTSRAQSRVIAVIIRSGVARMRPRASGNGSWPFTTRLRAQPARRGSKRLGPGSRAVALFVLFAAATRARVVSANRSKRFRGEVRGAVGRRRVKCVERVDLLEAAHVLQQTDQQVAGGFSLAPMFGQLHRLSIRGFGSDRLIERLECFASLAGGEV